MDLPVRLRLRQHLTSIGGIQYRVVQPFPPLRRTALADPMRYGWLVGDQDGLARLGALFAFAAMSRRTIVYVALREGGPIDGWEDYLDSCGGRVDLVLVHHSLQLRVSRWPQLRARLGRGVPLTVHTDEHRWSAPPPEWSERLGQQDFRDWLRPAMWARTLFLVGGRDSFRAAVGEFTFAASNGPGAHGVNRGPAPLMATLTPLLEPAERDRPVEIDISFRGPAGACGGESPVG
jgi:hypothetical protein